MIDLNEDLISLTDATKILPRRNNKRPHFCTILRWCKNGIDGVKLESCRVGGTLFTSRQAIQRFVNARSDSVRHTPPRSQPNRAERASRSLKADFKF